MTARIAAAWAVGLFAACAASGPLEATAGPPQRAGISETLARFGTAGRDACRRAIDELPLDRMSPASRALVEHFRKSTTLHRRLPAETVQSERAFVEFVLEKPETLVDVWRVLGISRVSLDPVAPGCWRLSDGYGTTGMVRLLHQERGPGGGLLVFHGQGGYSGPLAPQDLTGSCLVVVRHAPAADGGPGWRVELEAFLDVDGLGLEIVTRTLQPLIVRSAAANIHEICLFLSQFAAAAARNPAGVARLAGRMSQTPPTDQRLLVSLAAGTVSPSAHPPAGETGPDAVREELAARWLPAESLDATRR
jgi:hypothetical protein